MTSDTLGRERPQPLPPQPVPAPGRRRPARRRRLNWARLFAVLAVFAAFASLGVAIRDAGGVRGFLEQVTGRVVAVMVQQPDRSLVARRPNDPITMLVLGTENAPDYAGPQLTDSMMLWSYDPVGKQAAILSIPRDLWVDIPGVGQERINAAYEDGGPATAALTVERYVGVPVQYYAIVDYNAFVKLVNDVGGIDVDVPYNIDDPCYPNVAENKCTVFRLSAGMHHMDGALALQFARERHAVPQGDITREADQRLVLFALKDALLQPRNLLHLPAIISDMEQLVTTNLPASQWPQLADEVLHLPKTSIASAGLDYASGAVTNYTTAGGAEVLLPHPAAIAKVVRPLFAPVLRDMTQAEVQVENGAPTSQPLATYFSQVLQGMGVTTLPAVQAPTTDYARSLVIWNTAAASGAQPPAMAYILAQMLNAQITQKPVAGTPAPIVVILGGSFPKVQP
jgi:LCP family protein required for cell wall assembly